VEFALPAV